MASLTCEAASSSDELETGERAEEQGDFSSAEGSGDESDSSGPEEENVELELREVDDVEGALQIFKNTTCGCFLKEGSPCSGSFSIAELRERRMMMAELESIQLDCVILVLIAFQANCLVAERVRELVATPSSSIKAIKFV